MYSATFVLFNVCDTLRISWEAVSKAALIQCLKRQQLQSAVLVNGLKVLAIGLTLAQDLCELAHLWKQFV